MNHRRPVRTTGTISWFYVCVRAAICATLTFAVLHLHAADVNSSCPALTPADNQSSLSSTTQVAAGSECKSTDPGKHDVNRIGRRKVGKGINLYSVEKERELGEAMAAAIDRQAKLVTDPQVLDYINRLGQKIVRNSDAQVPFTFKVIDAKTSTTFSLPGGFLYVDKALILDVDDEAQLAGLMAHEIAHVVARHTTRFITRKSGLDVLVSFPVAKTIGPLAIPARQIGLIPLEMKFNRDYEFEADLLGIQYQYAAGYDPEAYIAALEKLDGDEIQKHLRAASNQPKPDFIDRLYLRIGQSYSPYPATEVRILRLQTEISSLPCRNEYVLDSGEFEAVKAHLGAERLLLRRLHPGDSTNGPVLERRLSE
jgi:beta-barrel assembly-enhancing protease